VSYRFDLEIKHKHLGRVVKRRARLPLEMALAIGAGEIVEDLFLPESDRRITEEAHRLVREQGFHPCCCMRYDRHAYADRDPESDLRITFDTGIAYRFDDLKPMPDDRRFDKFLLPNGFSVLEVKVTGCVPYWLSRLIAQFGCIFQSHSKYCNALEDGDSVLHAQLGGRAKVQYGVAPPLVSLDRVSLNCSVEESRTAAAMRQFSDGNL
jgi:hypothetical protein